LFLSQAPIEQTPQPQPWTLVKDTTTGHDIAKRDDFHSSIVPRLHPGQSFTIIALYMPIAIQDKNTISIPSKFYHDIPFLPSTYESMTMTMAKLRMVQWLIPEHT
jgi:hypothetical protein